MKINTADLGLVRLLRTYRGTIHAFDNFGDPWCEGDFDPEGDPISGDAVIESDWCRDCLALMIEEELIL